LAKYFDTTPEFWLNLQARFEIETAHQNLDGEIASIEPHRKRA